MAELDVNGHYAEKVDEIAYWIWQTLDKGTFDAAVRRAESDSVTAKQVVIVRGAARGAIVCAGRMPARTEGEFEQVAKELAADLSVQAARIRELIRERDAAKGDREAALDLAEQYARQLGVDISRDRILKYVEQYWEQRGKFERDWQGLEALRWEMFQLDKDLEAGLANGGVDQHTGRQVAEHVRRWLRSQPSLGGREKRTSALFARPPAPLQGDLFGVAR